MPQKKPTEIPTATNVIISAFRTYGSRAVDTDLQRFLDVVSGRRPNPFVATIDRIREIARATPDKKAYAALKASLPSVTISTHCRAGQTHGAANCDGFNGLLCLDLDAPDNLQIPCDAWGDVRDALFGLPYVRFCAKSVSGKGIFIVVDVDPDENPKETYNALLRHFADHYRLNLDPNCNNFNRLRGMSYDPEAKQKTPTARFKPVCTHIAPPPKPTYHPRPENASGDEYDRIRTVCELWREHGLPLDYYKQWFTIGAALQALPDGRDLFHALSATSPKYDPRATDRKFKECRNTHVKVGAVVNLARENGITDDEIRERYRERRRDAAGTPTPRREIPPPTQTLPRPSTSRPTSRPTATPTQLPRPSEWLPVYDVAVSVVGDEQSMLRQLYDQRPELWPGV